jgi:hypothetical protein
MSSGSVYFIEEVTTLLDPVKASLVVSMLGRKSAVKLKVSLWIAEVKSCAFYQCRDFLKLFVGIALVELNYSVKDLG